MSPRVSLTHRQTNYHTSLNIDDSHGGSKLNNGAAPNSRAREGTVIPV